MSTYAEVAEFLHALEGEARKQAATIPTGKGRKAREAEPVPFSGGMPVELICAGFVLNAWKKAHGQVAPHKDNETAYQARGLLWRAAGGSSKQHPDWEAHLRRAKKLWGLKTPAGRPQRRG
jgi:hypothetical protein